MASRCYPHLVATGFEFKHVFGGGTVGLHVHVVPAVRGLDEAAVAVANPVVAAVVAGYGERLDGATGRVDVEDFVEVTVIDIDAVAVGKDELVVISPQLVLLFDIFPVVITPMTAVVDEKRIGFEAAVVVQVELVVEDLHLGVGQMRVYQGVIEMP